MRTLDIELPEDFGKDSPLAERPHISIDPAIMNGESCVSGTRIPTLHIAVLWWGNEWTLNQILQEYPSLTRDGIILACWYMGTFGYGNTIWRKRWGQWARTVFGNLWHRQYEQVSLPPRKGEA